MPGHRLSAETYERDGHHEPGFQVDKRRSRRTDGHTVVEPPAFDKRPIVVVGVACQQLGPNQIPGVRLAWVALAVQIQLDDPSTEIGVGTETGDDASRNCKGSVARNRVVCGDEEVGHKVDVAFRLGRRWRARLGSDDFAGDNGVLGNAKRCGVRNNVRCLLSRRSAATTYP